MDVTFGMIGGDAYDNENLAGHLNAKLDVDGTIDCGNYAARPESFTGVA